MKNTRQQVFRVGDLVMFSGKAGVVLFVHDRELTLVPFEEESAATKDEYIYVPFETNSLRDGMFQKKGILRLDRISTVEKQLCIRVDTLEPVQTERLIRKMCKVFPRTYHDYFHRRKEFVPGLTPVHYAGRVYDHNEILNIVDSALDFWLTAGRFVSTLERRMRDYFDCKSFYLVNSGSSANLLMISSLTSKSFERTLKAGDEVITPAVAFPTTVTPIVQNQLIPVFVDSEVGTYNIDPSRIEDAIGPRTRAIFISHTLGNPCDMDAITDIAERKDLVLIEDCCDALGSTYGGRLVGTFGDMPSLSFYPAHHMTMGEGGGVVVNNDKLARIVLSLRDWGRECWCEPGRNNSCGKRFSLKRGGLPYGYDHKYVYSQVGFNLKVTEMQAAVGLAQFEKLDWFVSARRDNFRFLYNALSEFEDKLILPRWSDKSNPSWFGFPLTLRDGSETKGLIKHLEASKIETRKIFAGNILRQPGFMGIPHRVHGSLEQTDKIMNDSFFVGVFPGLTEEMLEFVVGIFKEFFKR